MTNIKPELTAEVARDLLTYNPETGVLRWREREPKWFTSPGYCKTWNTKHAGREAGCVNKDKHGYWQSLVGVFGKTYRTPRVVWLLVTGEWPEGDIDHEDQDSLNNAWHNLRDVPHQDNIKNCSLSKNNKTGVVGVIWYAKHSRWRAQIRHNGKCHHLGQHTTLLDAVAARKRAERELGFHPHNGKAKVMRVHQ